MKRRDALKDAGIAAMAGAATMLGGKNEAMAQTYAAATKGLPPLKTTKVKAISTAPDRTRLTVVKVETSEPGLYGIGCATYQQRPLAVESAVNDYLDPFCQGKDPDNIEDMWQTAYVSSYWRNGPVLNNAMSGLDQALWDIKAKRAGMPLHQLFGGKCRFAVPCYTSAGGRTFEELGDGAQGLIDRGYRVVKIQLGGYGSNFLSTTPDFKNAGFGVESDSLMDVGPYLRATVKSFEEMRKRFGDEIDFLHDVHERIPPIDAVKLCKDLEQYRPFFIEDPLSPEDNGYFKLIREQCATPIAMGELYNNPHEWVGLITNRLIDFIRIHVSQIGGVTPALKVARLAEWFNVRTAWHGPNDVSPVGHACQAHIDLAAWNFGIQECRNRSETVHEVFPGTPVHKKVESGIGYLFVNEAPGHGVTINEKEAAKYPIAPGGGMRLIRRSDGTSVRP